MARRYGGFAYGGPRRIVAQPRYTIGSYAQKGYEARLRRRMNNELNFPPNFERLVLGCIDADFCK